MSSTSIDQSTAPASASPISGVGVIAATIVTVIASGAHLLASWAGAPLDSLWFTVAGFVFLAVTVSSHAVLSRGETAGSASAGEIGSLLISMAIRLSGTFLILGSLLAISPLSRTEAVSTVLFWYITLTVIDLAGVVRERMRAENVSATGRTMAIERNRPE
jgi:hypothetical protein